MAFQLHRTIRKTAIKIRMQPPLMHIAHTHTQTQSFDFIYVNCLVRRNVTDRSHMYIFRPFKLIGNGILHTSHASTNHPPNGTVFKAFAENFPALNSSNVPSKQVVVVVVVVTV